MQTSCGSPCYAAPELVISEGLYVGSAVDIWSCGVILYAMLAGYLPFDDDPANPDGDNINLLYKYIVSTPLSFPDYISMEARDLLSMMLVPDPARRTSLDGVMHHPWLSLYHQTRTDDLPNAFGKTVDDLERQALEQHQQRRRAYQRQMRVNTVANGPLSPSRTQSHSPHHGTTPQPASRSRSTQAEYLYDSSAEQPMSPASAVQTTPTQNEAPKRTYGSPAALELSEDDPFAGPGGSVAPNTAIPVIGSSSSSKPRTSGDASRAVSSTLSPNASSPKRHNSINSGSGGGGFRHTIQVEYDDSSKTPKRSKGKRPDRTGSQGQSFRNSVTIGGSSHHREREVEKSHPYGQLRIHHGAVDQMMVTTKAPPEVMAHVKKILEGVGVETQLESEYKFKCRVRARKRKGTMGHSAGANVSIATSGSGLAAVTLVGTATSNEVSSCFFLS